METEEQKQFLKELRELLDKHHAELYTQKNIIGAVIFKEDSELIFAI